MQHPRPLPAAAPVSATVPQQARIEDTGPLHTFGLVAMLAFVFLYVCRILDLYLAYLHLPLVLALMMSVVATLCGSWITALKTRAAVLYGAMAFWMIAGIPFSIWRGGTFGIVINQWLLRSIMVSLLALGFIVSFKEVTALMNTLAYATAFAALLALRGGETVGGRLVMQSSKLGNPNDLAFALLIGVPLWCRYITGGQVTLFRKVLGLGALGAILVALAKTGSRAAFLSVLIMLLIAFLRASLGGKVKLLATVLVLCALALVALPSSLRQRYITFDTAGAADDSDMVGKAAGSAEQRRSNLMDSLRITMENPLFGVGAGNFQLAQDTEAKAAGKRRGCLARHTQHLHGALIGMRNSGDVVLCRHAAHRYAFDWAVGEAHTTRHPSGGDGNAQSLSGGRGAALGGVGIYLLCPHRL